MTNEQMNALCDRVVDKIKERELGGMYYSGLVSVNAAIDIVREELAKDIQTPPVCITPDEQSIQTATTPVDAKIPTVEQITAMRDMAIKRASKISGGKALITGKDYEIYTLAEALLHLITTSTNKTEGE